MTPRRRQRRAGGFGLVEVVAATAVLLIGVAATGGLFSLASRITAQGSSAACVRSACTSTTESLLALPFRAAGAEGDLVTAVFPHADPGRNTAAARFVTGEERAAQPGSFVTRRQDGTLRTRVVATFVKPVGMSLQSLGVEQVMGWTGGPGDPAPSDALLVSVFVSNGRTDVGQQFVAAADRDVRRLLGGAL